MVFKMMKISRLFILLFVLTSLSINGLNAQNTSIKLGVNNVKLIGKPEKDASGKALESFESVFAFTGALVTEVALQNEGSNEEGGVRFEMTYFRNKFKWLYNGSSYQIFDTEGGKKVYATGQKTVNLTLTTNYFKLPIMMYQRFESGFELAFGLDLGLNIGTQAKGNMTFQGKTESGENVPLYTAELNYNYSKDKVTTVELSDVSFTANGETIKLPKSMGAYYETRVRNAKPYNPFNRFNVGLNGDVAYWFGDAIGLRLRGNYNFFDFTSNKNTFIRQSLNPDKTPILRKSYENLFSYQLTLEVKL